MNLEIKCRYCGNIFTKAIVDQDYAICSKCRKPIQLVEGFYRIPKGDPITPYAKSLHNAYRNRKYSEMIINETNSKG